MFSVDIELQLAEQSDYISVYKQFLIFIVHYSTVHSWDMYGKLIILSFLCVNLIVCNEEESNKFAIFTFNFSEHFYSLLHSNFAN